MDVPGPPTYQEIISKPIHFDEAFKSFNVGATRFPAINKVIKAPQKVYFEASSPRHIKIRYMYKELIVQQRVIVTKLSFAVKVSLRFNA